MCLAIVKPKGVIMPSDHLRQGWIHNPDGGGFAYVHKGKVKIEKGFTTLAEFLQAYDKASKKNPHSNFLIHFRIKTHGTKTADNTHPFPIKGGALIHNGTISGTPAKSSEGRSDTAFFAEKVDGKVTKDIIKANIADWNTALESNKVAFLFDDGDYAVINEHIGHWKDGVWYSNYSYQSFGRSAYSRSDIYD